MAKTARQLSIEELATVYGLSKSNVQSAIDFATHDTLKWGDKESSRGLARVLNLPYPTIRKRMKLRATTGRGNIWYGFNSLALMYANPTITGKGVSAGGKYFPDAFEVKSAYHIFERDGRRGVMSAGRYAGKIRERITKAKLPIDDRAMAYLPVFVEQARSFFIDRLIKHLSDLASSAGQRTRLDYNGATLDIAKSLAPKINS